MLEPLKQFFCDTCEGIIEKPEDGWVEWLTSYDDERERWVEKNFRICHHVANCMRLASHPDVSDNHLHNLLEDNTMVIQLYGMLESESDPNGGFGVEDIGEVVEFLRRLTLPYYEEARRYWEEAIKDGCIRVGVSEIHPYLPRTLKGIIERYGD
jgi:hypothetical protein